MKKELKIKFKESISKSNIIENLNINISIDDLALICVNKELDLLQSCHYVSSEKTTQYIIEDSIKKLGALR